jgi:D-alanyl-D-alanine carboxypeptidase/D-alanyl-D-alanine-endopeptidase (penicillin-binding protein 4)
MKLQHAVILFSLVVFKPDLALSASSEGICESQLPQAIAEITERPELRRSRWGIAIEPLAAKGDRPIYDREGNRYFIPASNAKLLTTAAALQTLGANFRITTSVYGPGPVGSDGVLSYIRIVGRGDPSFGEAQMRSLASQLRDRGVRQITQAIAHDGYFPGSPIHPNWEWEDIQAGYGAPVTSLIYRQNAVELTVYPQAVGQPLRLAWTNPAAAGNWQVENRTTTVETDGKEWLQLSRDFAKQTVILSGQLRAGSPPEDVAIAVGDPTQHFLENLQRIFAEEGIRVLRVTSSSEEITGETEIAKTLSPNLAQLVQEVNEDSNNLYAEVLLRSLGVATNEATNSAIAAGLNRLKTSLTQLGVDPDTYQLGDGSGLSRQSLVSPQAFVQTLRAMALSPNGSLYRESLPLAGNSGTLKWRFRETPAFGRVRAKTGTLTGVSSLSGYVDNEEYDTLLFSIMVNQSERSASVLRGAIDEIVVLLTTLKRC